jgi:hypothetical protein
MILYVCTVADSRWELLFDRKYKSIFVHRTNLLGHTRVERYVRHQHHVQVTMLLLQIHRSSHQMRAHHTEEEIAGGMLLARISALVRSSYMVIDIWNEIMVNERALSQRQIYDKLNVVKSERPREGLFWLHFSLSLSSLDRIHLPISHLSTRIVGIYLHSIPYILYLCKFQETTQKRSVLDFKRQLSLAHLHLNLAFSSIFVCEKGDEHQWSMSAVVMPSQSQSSYCHTVFRRRDY